MDEQARRQLIREVVEKGFARFCAERGISEGVGRRLLARYGLPARRRVLQRYLEIVEENEGSTTADTLPSESGPAA